MAHIVVLIAARQAGPLHPAEAARAMESCAGRALTWLADGQAAEFATATAPNAAALLAALSHQSVDIIVTPARGRRKAVLVADMDSTIVTGETLDELAAEAGLKDRIVEITARSMNGEMDFPTALRERVAMLRGLPLAALDRTWSRTRYSPGAKTLVATMRAFGATTALVSGGFSYFTARVAAELGFDLARANTLLDDGAALTGAVAEPVLDRDAKLATLRELAARRGVQLSATLAVGDGANDLAMLEQAGLGVAYHAKPVVAAAVRNQIRHTDLRSLLYAQGYPAAAFKEGSEE